MTQQRFIQLDQFLKLAGLVQSGGEGKHAVQSGEVLVDGQVETRRGRKLYGGEVVQFQGKSATVSLQ